MYRFVRATCLSLATVPLALSFTAIPVFAQNEGSSVLELEEIVVTARRRDESLQDIPIAITAFGREQLDNAGFRGLEDLSLQVAGLQYSSQGGQLPGRFTSSLRFRGMNVNNLSEDPSKNVGTLFLDGIYVLGGTHTIPLEEVDPEYRSFYTTGSAER